MSSEKPIQSRPDASNEARETTAQWAKLEAATRELSDEVERNARREAETAKDAASAAPVCFLFFFLFSHFFVNIDRFLLFRIFSRARAIRPTRHHRHLMTSNGA